MAAVEEKLDNEVNSVGWELRFPAIFVLKVIDMDHPERKRIRLKDYDYSQNGAYFVTICTKGREPLLSQIVGDGLCTVPQTVLSSIGIDIEKSIQYINANYYGVSILKYVIMPNHVHLIVLFEGGHGNPPLQKVIGMFKSFTTRIFNATSQDNKILWQRSFYDHIIRNEQEYLDICEYIDSNPYKWREDEYYES